MATKAKTLQVKDKEKDDKAADAPEKDSADAPSPLLDLSDAAVKKMIKQAKKRGFVTFDQLNEVLPSDTTSPEQIEDIMSMDGPQLGLLFGPPATYHEAHSAEPRAPELVIRHHRAPRTHRSATSPPKRAPTASALPVRSGTGGRLGVAHPQVDRRSLRRRRTRVRRLRADVVRVGRRRGQDDADRELVGGDLRPGIPERHAHVVAHRGIRNRRGRGCWRGRGRGRRCRRRCR